MNIIIFIYLLIFVTLGISVSYNVMSFCSSLNEDVDYGDPLILTPLINCGKIEEAQSKAAVYLEDFQDIPSYSGYFTVNKKFNSNLFFWYFVSNQAPEDAPVILWLQGGPGISSLYGLFMENGPFKYKTNRLIRRQYSWHKKYHMIYIDNPVGSGYSFTDGGYAENQTAIGNELYSALIQFFKLFPDLQKNDFFITGESYAGKFIPSASYAIHEKNKNASLKINLKGFAMGNAYSYPLYQNQLADFIYQIGLIDKHQHAQMRRKEIFMVHYLKNKRLEDALKIVRENHAYVYGSLIQQYSGFNSLYDLLNTNADWSIDELHDFLESPKLMKALHTLNYTQYFRYDVPFHLENDIVLSVADLISELLSHYKVIIYNGQMDILVGYRATEDYLMNLTFSGDEEFRNASRKLWMVDDKLAGYAKTGGNLTLILVRNAGHVVPSYQPKWTLDIIDKLTSNKNF